MVGIEADFLIPFVWLCVAVSVGSELISLFES